MSLDGFAVIVLALLVPGAVFFITIDQKSKIDRSLANSALTELSAALLSALLIHAVCVPIFYGLVWLCDHTMSWPSAQDIDRIPQLLFDPNTRSSVSLDDGAIVVIYMLCATVIGHLMARMVLSLIHRGWEWLDFVYGPLLPFVTGGRGPNFVARATILTKHQYSNLSLMFVGYVDSIGVSKDKTISSIVLWSPSRYLMQTNYNGTSFTNPVPIDDDDFAEGRFFIDGSDISNIYIERREAVSLATR